MMTQSKLGCFCFRWWLFAILGCGGVSQVRAAGSPFYDVEVLARIGDEVAGEDVATTYLATIDPQVCGNDLGRAVFVGVVSETGGTRFWNLITGKSRKRGKPVKLRLMPAVEIALQQGQEPQHLLFRERAVAASDRDA